MISKITIDPKGRLVSKSAMSPKAAIFPECTLSLKVAMVSKRSVLSEFAARFKYAMRSEYGIVGECNVCTEFIVIAKFYRCVSTLCLSLCHFAVTEALRKQKLRRETLVFAFEYVVMASA